MFISYLCERKSPNSDSLHLVRSIGLMDRAGDTGEMGRDGKVFDMIMVAMVVARAGSDKDGSVRLTGRSVAA